MFLFSTWLFRESMGCVLLVVAYIRLTQCLPVTNNGIALVYYITVYKGCSLIIPVK